MIANYLYIELKYIEVFNIKYSIKALLKGYLNN